MPRRKIILASKSYRRRKLLEQIGLKFEVRESEYEEDMSIYDDPYKLVKFLALEKGKDVARHYDDAIIISADTFVILDGKFIGKPKDKADAKRILRSFSGREHKIVSGFAIIDTKNNIVINDTGEALVKFKEMSDEEIDEYIATGDPMDKAGAYGIQDKASILIEGIKGDFYSIIAFPICKIATELRKMGVKVLCE